MTIAEIVSLVAPEKQGLVAAELAKYEGASIIDSREAAVAVIKGNKHIQAEVASLLSKQADDLRERLRSDELPKLVEAERAKMEAELKPKPKDPEVAAAMALAEKAQKELEEWKAKSIRSEQLNRVLPGFSELGLGPDIAGRFIGANDAETDAASGTFLEAVKAAMAKQVASQLDQKFKGGQAPDKGTPPADLKALHAEAEKRGDVATMLRLKTQMQAAG